MRSTEIRRAVRPHTLGVAFLNPSTWRSAEPCAVQLLRRFYDNLVLCGSWKIHFRPYLFKNLVYKIANTPIFGNIDNALMHSIAVEFPDDFD